MDLKPMFEEIKSNESVKGVLTIAKDANNREGWISFYKNLIKSIKGKNKPEQPKEKEGTPSLAEMAAPGREPQVKKLKKKLPKSYKDKKTGKKKKSNSWAVSYDSHNKGKKKVKEQEKPDKEDDKEEDDDSENYEWPTDTSTDAPADNSDDLENIGKEKPKTKGPKDTESPEEKDPRDTEEEPTGTKEGEDFKPGVVPSYPKGEPKLFGPGVELFRTPYANIKTSEYTIDFRTKRLPDGKILCELTTWDAPGGAIKGGKGENLKFNHSYIMTFANKETFTRTLREMRWIFYKEIENEESRR